MAGRVFLTGASGYVGRHIAAAFLERGYGVAGLARSDRAAATVARLGAAPVRGALGEPETYRDAAAAADVVIHAGFEYDRNGNEVPETDQTATRALLSFADQGRASSLIYCEPFPVPRALGRRRVRRDECGAAATGGLARRGAFKADVPAVAQQDPNRNSFYPDPRLHQALI